MVRMILKIDGMACGMCEAHVNDAIRRVFSVKKVTSSHRKGEAEVIADQPLEEKKLRSVIAETGYCLTDIRTEPYVKKGFRLFR